MKRVFSILSVAALVALPVSAMATGSKPQNNQSQNQHQGQHQSQGQKQGQHQSASSSSDSSSSANSDSSATSSSKLINVSPSASSSRSGAKVGDVLATGHAGGGSAVSHGGVGIGGTSNAHASANNHGNHQTVIHEAPDLSERVPDPYMPALTTGDCLGSASGGVSAAGIGVGFGKTTLDEGCDARRAAILADNLGHEDMAYEMLCIRQPAWAQADRQTGRNDCYINQQSELSKAPNLAIPSPDQLDAVVSHDQGMTDR